MGLHLALEPVIGDALPFAFAFPAVAVVALAAGVMPGMATVVGCAVWRLATAWPQLPTTNLCWQAAVFTLPALVLAFACGAYGRRVRALRADPLPTALARPPASPMIRWLQATMVAALVVPTTFFVIAGWRSYDNAFEEARVNTLRACRLAEDFIARTFRINAQVFDRAAAVLGESDETSLRAREAELNQRLRDVTLGLDQVQSLWVWGADGVPIVVDKRYPAPPEIVANERVNFGGFRTGERGLWISERLIGRVSGDQFFNVVTPRQRPDGGFAGVIALAMYPGHFQEFYQALARDDPGLTLTMLREDGVLVARWPIERTQVTRLPSDSPLAVRIRAGETDGSFMAPSRIDGTMRLVAFKRVQGLPLYVAAGFNQDKILNGWYRWMATLAAMTFPIAFGLFYTTWLALQRTRREQQALAELGEQTERRARAEKTLLQTQKLEALGQLTGAVAHDFNNLLAVVGNNAHLAARLDRNGAAMAQLEAIQRAVGAGAQLTRQLLAFSRRQPLRPELIDLRERLPGLLDLVRTTVGRQVQVTLEVAPNTAPVEIDPSELELALINLALNARDAMPDGGQLWITAANADPASAPELHRKALVSIAVRDTGPGIDPEALPRVLEPFFTTKGPLHGTGLGLSQVHNACLQAGGRVRIDSQPGAGTTVTLVLPGLVAPPPVPPAAPSASDAPLQGSVLLVEDNQAVADATRALLESFGLDVRPARDADEALTVLQQDRAKVDVVLSDILMPGRIGGLDLALELRRQHPDLPVLLSTGFTPELERAVAAGLEVLPKPSPPHRMRDALARALAVTRGTASPAPPGPRSRPPGGAQT